MGKAWGESSTNKIILLRQARSYPGKQNVGAELPKGQAWIQVFFKPWTYWFTHYYLTFLTQAKEYFYLHVFILGSTEAWLYNVISHLQTNLIEDKARQTVEQSSPRIMNCHKN